MSPRYLLFLVALLAAAAACHDGPLGSGAPLPASIRIAPDSVIVRLGQTATLSTTVLDARGQPVASPRVRYASSRPEVVAVDSLTGVVTPVATGRAEITVTALPARAGVRVTVVPAGGGEVATLALDSSALTLETWSLAPQSMRYRVLNAAGESLCGLVPLAVQADSSAFTAQVAAGGDPCLITLLPRAERSGWLRVQAGEKRDSARISVHHTRYRWTFDLPSGPQVAGSVVYPEFAVWGEDGKPVAGFSVNFYLSGDSPYSKQVDTVTGPDGRVSPPLRLPPSTLLNWLGGPDSLLVTEARYYISAWAGDTIPVASTSAELVIVPDVPHHVGIYVHIVEFSELCFSSTCTLQSNGAVYAFVRGDSVSLRSYDRIHSVTSPPCTLDYPDCDPPAELYWTRDYHKETLVAVVADQYGNPTGVVPTLTAVTGTGVAIRERLLNSGKLPCCLWEEWIGGRGLAIETHDFVFPKQLTFTSPGIPARTFTLNRGG